MHVSCLGGKDTKSLVRSIFGDPMAQVLHVHWPLSRDTVEDSPEDLSGGSDISELSSCLKKNVPSTHTEPLSVPRGDVTRDHKSALKLARSLQKLISLGLFPYR